ncbi:hypothetical protein AF72_03790 [Xylella taiwanensis]|uniref:Uncharacterized protein n=1 Tax=Xylella taiwanensis TaxID=1444770 RepID=Z9JLQ7_9GAMM|nr:hypothetical protein AB672_03435 [Xylella taiwanensis]EWS78697.1 hypothetical protein AF72_03790 [Xylella taiwanensis]
MVFWRVIYKQHVQQGMSFCSTHFIQIDARTPPHTPTLETRLTCNTIARVKTLDVDESDLEMQSVGDS